MLNGGGNKPRVGYANLRQFSDNNLEGEKQKNILKSPLKITTLSQLSAFQV